MSEDDFEARRQRLAALRARRRDIAVFDDDADDDMMGGDGPDAPRGRQRGAGGGAGGGRQALLRVVQRMLLRPAQPGDAFGDVSVDTAKSRASYEKWLELTRSADDHSPDGTRRPFWMLRPVRPEREAYVLPERDPVGA